MYNNYLYNTEEEQNSCKMSWKGIITSIIIIPSNFIYISTNQNLMTKQEINLSEE